ncbi:MAG: 4Fe-4S binding protein, partial [Oscillospiraceae bacterium]|nr:4Fe-4S binding protein [Oscillospiraceae bacterium]
EHSENDWTPYAKAQPKAGMFWTRVKENIQGSQPKMKIFYLPTRCNHCASPSCLKACKNDAIYIREDGLVIIDPEKCKGCGECVSACPYEAISMSEQFKSAQKCTGCAHILDKGGIPRCVDVCPTGALKFGTEDELADFIEGASVLKPEEGTKPRTYYRNIPGQFIAGTLYDPESEEIIEGAVCRIVNGSKVWKTETDDFGDFWFKDLPVGIFELTIEAEGYKRIIMPGLRTRECINLGDIPAERSGE